MRLLYKDGFGAIGGVMLKKGTLFIAFLNEEASHLPLRMTHGKEKLKKTLE